MDLLKVSGWPLANVEAAHDQLVALFAPTSYSVREADQDWLLHGDLVAITATFALGQKPYFDDFYELVRCYEGYKQSDGHRTAESLPFYASTAPQTLEFHGTWQQYRMAVASWPNFVTWSDCYKLKGCGHVFCRICLNRQVLTCETSREKVPFACAACEEPFRPVDIQRLLLGYNLGYGEGFHAWWLDAEKLRNFTNARLNNLRTLADRPFFAA
ncbi:unnamed protein product, partial [Mesorhabditis spiculigera]